MAKKRNLHIQFPLAGINKRGAYRQQPPYTTFDCSNVRPVDSIEGRTRGGSRPGLMEASSVDLGSQVTMLTSMVYTPRASEADIESASESVPITKTDLFLGAKMSGVWETLYGYTFPYTIVAGRGQHGLATSDYDDSDTAAIHALVPYTVAETITIEIRIAPHQGAFHGKYRLYFFLNDADPSWASGEGMVELTMTGSSGAYSGKLVTYGSEGATEYALASGSTGSAEVGWLTVRVNSSTMQTDVSWRNIALLSQVAVDYSATSRRVGFGTECTVTGGLCRVGAFRFQGVQTFATMIGEADNTRGIRTIMVAVAGGDVYYWDTYGHLSVLSANPNLRDDVVLQSVQSGQKLYIADYGDLRSTGTDGSVNGTALDATAIADWTTLGIDTDSDVAIVSDADGTGVDGTYEIVSVAVGSVTLASAAGVGNCTYRIERAPKVYDPIAETLTIHSATTGQVPTGCPLICRYNDRIVQAGAEIAPHVWYMARKGDEQDYDYAQTDSEAAIAGVSSEGGIPGRAITALVPYKDDYLVIGLRDSIWLLRGDPGFGGSMDNVSRNVGIIGADAWCIGPFGEFIFLSLNGVYVMPAIAEGSKVVSLSREFIPDELLNVDVSSVHISMEYDVHDNGVHIFITPQSDDERTHWWIDWSSKSFWPMSYDANHEPFSTMVFHAADIIDSGVILGCRDGQLRRFSHEAKTDCGTAFSTHVLYGPMPLAASEWQIGSLVSIDATIAVDSDDVTWGVQPGDTYEEAVSASESDSGSWGEGANATEWPACSGQCFCLLVTGSSGGQWAMESIVAQSRALGRRRLP